MTVVVPERIQAALGAFSLSDSESAHDALCTHLSSLGVEARNRAFTRSGGAESETVQQHWHSFARSCDYMTKRLGDLLARLVQVRWIHARRVEASDSRYSWLARFAEMAVKDFHADASSLMDSLAPLVTQVGGPLPESVLRSPPGLSALIERRDSTRTKELRARVPDEVLRIVDATDRWWPLVRSLRHFLLHREHLTILFGRPEDGFLFQVYADRATPLITDPVLLWPQGSNVVDFEMYSAFVVAEVVALLDELGPAIGECLGIRLDHHMLTMGGEYADVVSSLHALAEKVEGVLSERT